MTIPHLPADVTSASSDTLSPAGFSRAQEYSCGDGTYYLLVPRRYGLADPCDGCMRRRKSGYALYYLGGHDRCENTGAWSCCLDCARNFIASMEGGAA